MLMFWTEGIVSIGNYSYVSSSEASRDLYTFGVKPYIDCIQETLRADNVLPRGTGVMFDIESYLANEYNTNVEVQETPEQMRKIWHIDIGFGPCNAIGGIKYTLLAVNKKTRTNLVFGLKNLTTSLLHAMQEFLLTCGPTPEIIRTDFDAKLIRGEVKQFLLSKQITIQASPPYRQHQNGLVKNWIMDVK